MVKLGNFFFRYRNALFPLVFLLAVLVGHPEYPLGSHDLDTAFDVLGVLIALLGQTLRAVTVGYEYIIRGGKDHRVYAETLVQGGVFGHCRNPLYVGNILIVVGVALMIHSMAFYLIVLPATLLAYTSMVAAEEDFLRRKFGAAYDEYCHRVPRWIPRWTGFRQSIAGMRFNWKRLLVKEFNTTFVLVAALPAIEFWKDYLIAGPSSLPPTMYLIAGTLFWLLLYLIVRTLKKTGYVRG